MRRALAGGVVGALLGLGLATVTAAPAAAAVPCAGSLTGTVTTSVEVLAGTSCNINGATIEGSVFVDAGASIAISNSTVYGPVSASQPADFQLQASQVNGNVTISGLSHAGMVCRSTIHGGLTYRSSAVGSGFDVQSGASIVYGPAGSVTIVQCPGISGFTTISGPVTFSNNAGGFAIEGANLGGNVFASGNTGGGEIATNFVSGSIICSGNHPVIPANSENGFVQGSVSCPHEIEVVFVPSDGSVVSSRTSLASGVTYVLEVAGTLRISGAPDFRSGDAEYFTGFQGEPQNCALGDELGIVVNPAAVGASPCLPGSPLWGAFNPSHRYSRNFTGTGAPVKFNLSDNFYPDNSGGLVVAILAF